MWVHPSIDGPTHGDIATTWLACIIIMVLALGFAELNAAKIGVHNAVHAIHAYLVAASYWLQSIWG
jgi:hypothetical protein